MSKSAREKKKYFICPLCGIKHKIVMALYEYMEKNN